ncbi:MAG: BamA/TamA family outer membrane protein [Candidatus Marinimicrobia bacterium]|nr:BamA/TamA family outer membrane protein [Candidatus Neomarinimicrobiota bacterium]MCF7922483.1 BamA/TamA family outer membrane protein [Candidatus Neomarinimicrobiota bacterium]
MGNHALTSRDLLKQIHIKEKRLVSKGSFYNRHHLAREMAKLEDYYTLHGFLDAKVTDSLSLGEGNVISIMLIIEEGKQYYLRDVTLSGNTVFSEQDYLDIIEFQTGSSFNTFKIRENLIEMLRLYQNHGYPLINIKDSVVVADSVSLFINVKEGPKLNIGRINIQALDQIPEKIIARELIFESGEIFNLTNIEESKRRLYETNLFNSVNISLGRVNLKASTIDIDVEVIAAKFRGFDMNMGVKQGYQESTINADPVLSIGLSGSWYHNNLFNQSRRIRVETKISSIYPSIFIPQQFKLDFFYVEPWISIFRIPLTINPFYWYIDNSNTNNNSPFSNTAYGLRAIMTYRWFRQIKIQSLAEWSQSNSFGTPNQTEDLYQEARKIGVKFTWDKRDNFFYPHHGFKFVVEPEMVGYFLGGEDHYMQFQSSFSSYWNLFADLVFAHNVNLAVAAQRDSGPDGDIPLSKRFFLGGNSSLRGFEQQGLGPADTLGYPLGGKMRMYTNFELRFPIYRILGGSMFLDVGNLWAEIQNAKISDLERAVGAGITIDTPIGPARIDYGIPLGAQHADKSGQWHIAIAYAF